MPMEFQHFPAQEEETERNLIAILTNYGEKILSKMYNYKNIL